MNERSSLEQKPRLVLSELQSAGRVHDCQVPGATREPFLIGGGMDAGIEHLLLDAGGQFIGSPATAGDAMEPAVLLFYDPSHRPAMNSALGVCSTYGWLVSAPDPTADSFAVPERSVVRALGRLAKLGVAPDRVIVRSVDVLPGQVRGIREALPPGTGLEITG